MLRDDFGNRFVINECIANRTGIDINRGSKVTSIAATRSDHLDRSLQTFGPNQILELNEEFATAARGAVLAQADMNSVVRGRQTLGFTVWIIHLMIWPPPLKLSG